MKYRIVDSHGTPLSNWVENPKEFLEHLAQRPDWVPLQHVENENGVTVQRLDELDTVTLTLTMDELELATNGLSNYSATHFHTLKERGTYDAVETLIYRLIDIHRKAFPARVKEIAERLNDRLVDYGLPEPPEEEETSLDALPEDLLKPEPYTETIFDGGREWLTTKSDAEDILRADEFENAADTADKLEQINAAKPNNERDDIFITKSEA